MSVKYLYSGPDCNLARFGAVRKGDILNFMDAEHDHMERNPHPDLSVWDGKTKLKPDDASDSKAERTRQSELAKSNNERTVRAAELKDKDQRELVEICKSLKAKGIAIDFRPDMPKADLVTLILKSE